MVGWREGSAERVPELAWSYRNLRRVCHPPGPLTKLHDWAADLLWRRPTDGGVPLPPRRLRYEGHPSTTLFRRAGRHFAELAVGLAGLQPTSAVLEVGSGVGRKAIALIPYLTRGSYHGLEIKREAVEWCRTAISTRHPNFQFDFADIYNGHYRPDGSIRPIDFVFPYDDGSFDIVFVLSVFTHMLPDDVEHYLAESRRVLVPGGRLFMTGFLLNTDADRAMQAGRPHYRFPVRQYPVGMQYEHDEIERVVAFDEDYILNRLRRNGFVVDTPIRYGSWPGRRMFTSYQDVIVGTRV